jgi:hypothetical protein
MNDLDSNVSVRQNSQTLVNVTETPDYQDIIKRLRILFKTEQEINLWLQSTNARTSKPPIAYINEGRFDVVSRIIGAMEYGIPS